jgi:hypothetical protein
VIALGYVQLGDFEAARALADRCFAPPVRIWTWMLQVAIWSQVAARTGSPDPEWLYGQLLPFSGELALAGIGAESGGAVDSFSPHSPLVLGGTLRQSTARAMAWCWNGGSAPRSGRTAQSRCWLNCHKDLQDEIRGAAT